ncbi:hypothetical protein BCR34DRAFT_103509 [Clohesyomyces aquaticus]|uniref:Secreted protein n=1 Tax=Clohesyomyces aquaticus TaxID=1231657 RepID=A0A1Y2A1H0_9PLEO|nr:hypothetical protein BCR34DRAFT_103509 [Clohesyomyces aquaticus]
MQHVLCFTLLFSISFSQSSLLTFDRHHHPAMYHLSGPVHLSASKLTLLLQQVIGIHRILFLVSIKTGSRCSCCTTHTGQPPTECGPIKLKRDPTIG